MLNADIIVYASPVYVWGFTAQLKTLLDRHCCLVKWKKSDEMKFLMEDKHTVLLTTCGGDAEHNADVIQDIFGSLTFPVKLNMSDYARYTANFRDTQKLLHLRCDR